MRLWTHLTLPSAISRILSAESTALVLVPVVQTGPRATHNDASAPHAHSQDHLHVLHQLAANRRLHDFRRITCLSLSFSKAKSATKHHKCWFSTSICF